MHSAVSVEQPTKQATHISDKSGALAPAKAPRHISWETFLKKYLNLDNMTVYAGEKVCSAAPALPGFSFSVAEVFKKEDVL
jgi:hypothetical protein